jgi:Flp pilus assembly protein TadD
MRLAWTLLALFSLAARPAWADKKLDQAVAKAEAQLAKGKDAEAVKILQKAVAQAPRDAEASLALMELFRRLGRRDEADAALATAGERAGSAPPAVRARVRTLQSALALREGAASDALAFAEEAVAGSAGAESLAALARAQARLGLAAARATADRAVAAGPGSPEAHLASGDARLAAGLDAEARAAYRRAVELDPRSAEAGATLGLAALALDTEDAYEEAAAAAQKAALLEPKNPLPKLVLGRILERRGRLDDARAAYEEAAALDPSWPSPRLGVLGVRLRQGDADGVLASLRALPEEFRATGEAELLLGRVLLQKEEWASAGAALDRAAVLLPGRAEVQALRGAAAYGAGELERAADAYGRAVELDPANVAHRTSHALHLGYVGRREEAMAALLEVTAKPEGQTSETWMALGGIYRAMEPPRVADAVAAYEKALTLDPKSGQAALGVARSYRAGRQWARAIAAYERVSSAFPKLDREGLLGTAWCYQLSGDDTRARFYTGLAARAGADVEPLRRAFARGGATADDFERAELVEGLKSKSAGEQARAVHGLLELGGPAVPSLAAALGRAGTSLAARELIVDGLSRLGPAAREALPQLDRLAGAAPAVPGPQESAEEKALREREARLAGQARLAAERIRGRHPGAP